MLFLDEEEVDVVVVVIVNVVLTATEVEVEAVWSMEVLKLVGGVGDEADLKRPPTEEAEDFRLEEALLLAEFVLKRRIITMDCSLRVPFWCFELLEKKVTKSENQQLFRLKDVVFVILFNIGENAKIKFEKLKKMA